MIGSKEFMREINEKRIIRCIFENTAIDRTSLIRETGLSGGTITKIIAELISKNIIKEYGEADSTGGRKPILLKLNDEFGIVIGIKIGVGYLHVVISYISGKIIDEKTVVTGNDTSPNYILDEIEKLISENKKSNIVGVGIAVSGVVDSKKGIVKNSFLLKWENFPIVAELNKKINIPVFVLNDVDSYAVGQIWKGKAKNYKHCIIVTVGTGIGGAIVINGKLHTSRGGVGEIGHMTIIKDGEKCSCGARGCLEAEACFTSLVKKIAKKTSSDSLKKLYESIQHTENSETEFLRKAKKIDPDITIKVFKEYGELIGIALKNLINIFAPEYIMIGGESLEFSEIFLDEAIRYAKDNSFGNLGYETEFDVDNLDEKIWTLGVIFRVIENSFFELEEE